MGRGHLFPSSLTKYVEWMYRRMDLLILSKTTHCWSITNCCTKWVLNNKAILNWHLKIICKAGIFCYLITIFYKVSVWFWAYALAYREINVRSADIILPSLGKNLHISRFKWKWQNLIIHHIYIQTHYHDQIITE